MNDTNLTRLSQEFASAACALGLEHQETQKRFAKLRKAREQQITTMVRRGRHVAQMASC